jgi:phosphohistidine swiveling domain-containing protein
LRVAGLFRSAISTTSATVSFCSASALGTPTTGRGGVLASRAAALTTLDDGVQSVAAVVGVDAEPSIDGVG